MSGKTGNRYSVKGVFGWFGLSGILPNHRIPTTEYRLLFLTKFDNGQHQTPGTISHPSLHAVSGHWFVQALGDVVVGGCAEPEQGDQVVWVAGCIFCNFVSGAWVLLSVAGHAIVG